MLPFVHVVSPHLHGSQVSPIFWDGPQIGSFVLRYPKGIDLIKLTLVDYVYAQY